jgi:hypothetical protein
MLALGGCEEKSREKMLFDLTVAHPEIRIAINGTTSFMRTSL